MDPEKLDLFVKQGKVEDVRRLVRLGTSLDVLVDKRSPLMRATINRKLPMACALLDMGASVDFKNEEGWTALHYAASKGFVDVMNVLLEAGAELEISSNTGRTPLAIACRKKQLALAKKLIAKEADASTRDNAGWTLLFQAVRSGSLEVVKWLVEDLNADPRLEVKGRSAMMVADANGEIARYLRDAVDNLPEKMPKRPIPREQPTVVLKCDSVKISGFSKSLQEESLVSGGADSNTVLKVRQVKHKVKPSSAVYDTTTDPPGLVLLLIYKKFTDEDCSERKGAECDATNLTSVFKQMGYKVELHKDLNWNDTIWVIDEFSTSERLKKVGCSIVVVSSHGGNEVSSFATSDGKDISVRYLHQLFIENQSREVMQMAKIFFFQFCRGKIEPTREMDIVRRPENIISFFSTSDGFVSYRHNKKGSYFLSIVCEVLAERAYEDNLDDLFREVQLRYELEGLGTTPEKQDLGFKKKFYFNPQARE